MRRPSRGTGPIARPRGPQAGPATAPNAAPQPGAAQTRPAAAPNAPLWPATRPFVLADLPTAALDRDALLRGADLLAGSVDGVLIGDHPGARVQFPPSYRALLLRDRGVAVWAGLNCRDRNRVALEGELAALADAGVAAVHCVTGDHTAIGHRPDAAPVFDLDATRLAALARAAGLLVSVAESPCAPPAHRRPARLAEKVRAGAQVCVVNHAGGRAPVAEFVAAGPDIPYIACVPVVLGPAQARLLAAFPGLVLPPGFLDGILDAPDPAVAGIDAAVRLAEELLDVPGVRGVDLGRRARQRLRRTRRPARSPRSAAPSAAGDGQPSHPSRWTSAGFRRRQNPADVHLGADGLRPRPRGQERPQLPADFALGPGHQLAVAHHHPSRDDHVPWPSPR